MRVGHCTTLIGLHGDAGDLGLGLHIIVLTKSLRSVLMVGGVSQVLSGTVCTF